MHARHTHHLRHLGMAMVQQLPWVTLSCRRDTWGPGWGYISPGLVFWVQPSLSSPTSCLAPSHHPWQYLQNGQGLQALSAVFTAFEVLAHCFSPRSSPHFPFLASLKQAEMRLHPRQWAHGSRGQAARSQQVGGAFRVLVLCLLCACPVHMCVAC